MDTIKACFDTILRADQEQSRKAARHVRKLVYSSSATNKDKYRDIVAIVAHAPKTYTRIVEDWRQENFVMAVQVMYFLHDREANPDFLFPWLFQLLQHQNGYIRHAAVKMLRHEIGPLTYHIRFPGEQSTLGDKLTPERADTILRSLFMNLHSLETASWNDKFKKYKYIDDLPPSPYKSVQLVLAELEDSCGERMPYDKYQR